MEARRASCFSQRNLTQAIGWMVLLFGGLLPMSVLVLPVTVPMAVLLDFLTANLLVWTAVLLTGLCREARTAWRIGRLLAGRAAPRRGQGLSAAHFVLN